ELTLEKLRHAGGPLVVAVGRRVAPVRRRDRVQHLGQHARVVVAREPASAHPCSDNRWPFILDAASLSRNAIPSAMCSASVKLSYDLSGFCSRICGVTMALTTTMFAVPPWPFSSSG